MQDTRRPVKLELTRAEQFIRHLHPASDARHGQDRGRDKRRAYSPRCSCDVLSNTGAYGNHGPGVMFHGAGESVALYRCENKQVDAFAVYTNTLPAGAFRGYGLSQTNFAIESAVDEVARRVGMDPFAFRRLNVVVPGDPMVSYEVGAHDVEYGSYGLDQCLDKTQAALDAVPRPDLGADWLIGRGLAAGMIDTIPPRGHFADCVIRLAADACYDLYVGTAEFGNGTTTVHGQIAASALRTTVDRIRVHQSDTDVVRHDTGAYGSTGTVVAGMATHRAAQALAARILEFATQTLGRSGDAPTLHRETVAWRDHEVLLSNLARLAAETGAPLEADGRATGTPRSVAFNVQAFEVAVHRCSGVIRILRSIHAADAGTVMNPLQCRGQVEGGVAQAIGAALYEEVLIDAEGRVSNAAFRGYHIPAFADVPRTEVHFADTYDSVGPLGAKSMSESPYNPVAAALGNAVCDATGVRPTRTPFKADELYRHVIAK